ncbi:hypothetical protein ABZX92_39435 [Lentzea sp. NPDC006480]|uniref:hypothetical protein n=1 Tax=Lentzea sp. NPDC006480 TaxID=3157176 RepID=UPI00339EF9B9
MDHALTRLLPALRDHAGGRPENRSHDANETEELLADLTAITPVQAELAVLRTAPTTAHDGPLLRVIAHLQTVFAYLGANAGINPAVTELRSARHLLTAITDKLGNLAAG